MYPRVGVNLRYVRDQHLILHRDGSTNSKLVKIQLVFHGLVSVSGSTLENRCNKPAFLCLL